MAANNTAACRECGLYDQGYDPLIPSAADLDTDQERLEAARRRMQDLIAELGNGRFTRPCHAGLGQGGHTVEPRPCLT